MCNPSWNRPLLAIVQVCGLVLFYHAFAKILLLIVLSTINIPLLYSYDVQGWDPDHDIKYSSYNLAPTSNSSSLNRSSSGDNKFNGSSYDDDSDIDKVFCNVLVCVGQRRLDDEDAGKDSILELCHCLFLIYFLYSLPQQQRLIWEAG